MEEEAIKLIEACENGDFITVEQLLKLEDIDVNYDIEKYDCKKFKAPLTAAMVNYHPEVVRLLLAHPGIKLTGATKCDYDLHGLKIACEKGHTECVRLYLADERCTADLHIKLEDLITAAMENNHSGRIS